jgi:predicted outer membrane repeat protein
MSASRLFKISIVLLATILCGLGLQPAGADETGTIRVPVPVPTIAVHDNGAELAEFEFTSELASGSVQWLSRPGEPDLPSRAVTLLLPPDADLTMVDVQLSEPIYSSLEGSWDVAPAAPPATRVLETEIVHWPEDRLLNHGRDRAIYTSADTWPTFDVQILGAGQLRQWRLLQVAVPLFRYRPASGELSRLDQAELVVSYERLADSEIDLPAFTPAALVTHQRQVQDLTLNFDRECAAYKTGSSSDDALPIQAGVNEHYAIITTDAIALGSTQLANFVTHKQNVGFSVQVITETDFSGGVGDVAAENIRTWLQNHYLADNITHVLLVGNPDPNSAGVPMKLTYPALNHPTPTDYYYADLTGNWDLDGDGYTGEYADDFDPGGVDRYAELIVGRIPYYGDIAELDSILSKSIAYETEADPTWRKNVLLPMRPSDELTPGFHLGEAIKDNLLAVKNWPYHRIYDETFGLNPPPETTPCTEPIVSGIWSTTPFGLSVWWAHGNITWASGIMSSGGTASLNDTYPTIVFQAVCANAYPEEPDNLSYTLLKNGGIVTVGATRTSWYIVGQVLFEGKPSNAGMAYEFSSRIVGARTSCGFALNDLRERIYPTVMEFWKNYVAFNIYGDPSLHMLPLVARRYVNASASSGGDGTSWATAYTDLQDALADVPQEIWVAAGTYSPDRATGNRALSFQLVNGVEIYGGFAGDETTFFQRDPSANPTILSGDLLGDDDPNFINREDNSYHVVTGRNTIATAILDGFIISGGAANNGSNDDGGGLWCEVSGHPTISHCTFEDNLAEYGGAIRCDGVSSPTIISCIFRNNLADYYGAGYGGGIALNNQSSPTLYNCTFVGNRSARSGGGMYYRYGTNPTLVNCTFALNHANNGGGIYGNNSSDAAYVYNSIFWGNTRFVFGEGIVADESGQIMNCWGMTINNSCVQAWSSGGGGSGSGTGNTASDPMLVDADGADDLPGTADDDLHLLEGSPAQDTGDNAYLPVWMVTDLDGAPRIMNNIVDMGAHEYEPADILPGDCDFDGDVDFDDLESALSCVSGPEFDAGGSCACKDVDLDTDVDLRDLCRIQQEFTGPLP